MRRSVQAPLEAWLTVSGIEYEVGAPAIGQLRDFEQIDFTFQSRFPLSGSIPLGIRRLVGNRHNGESHLRERMVIEPFMRIEGIPDWRVCSGLLPGRPGRPHSPHPPAI